MTKHVDSRLTSEEKVEVVKNILSQIKFKKMIDGNHLFDSEGLDLWGIFAWEISKNSVSSKFEEVLKTMDKKKQ